ncbi:MAG: hypothetical protein J0L75_05990 [Spirochaetes bacterium]|nr:hypothetical protein [Spirochaetota bacterium]
MKRLMPLLFMMSAAFGGTEIRMSGAVVQKTPVSTAVYARKAYHWNQFPDDPEGRHILFVQWPDGLEKPAQLMISRLDGSEPRVLVEAIKAIPHTGVMALWIGEESFVHRGPSNEIVVRESATGKILRTITCGNCGPVSYHPGTGLVLTGSFENGNVWTVDPRTGVTRKILDIGAFSNWKERMGGAVPQNIWHRYWSPKGGRIWVKVQKPEFAFTFSTNGNEVRFFPGPGAHPFWWDNERIYAGGTLFDLDRVQVGPPVARTEKDLCHPGVSPDRRWIAGETWYGSSPLVLSLDYAGAKGTRRHFLLDETTNVDLVWKRRIHVDSSFSRDGRYLYVNWPTESNGIGVFRYDLIDLQRLVAKEDP